MENTIPMRVSSQKIQLGQRAAPKFVFETNRAFTEFLSNFVNSTFQFVILDVFLLLMELLLATVNVLSKCLILDMGSMKQAE